MGCYNSLTLLILMGFPPPPGFDWVGWKNESLQPVEIVFDFDQPRRFSSVEIYPHLPDAKKDLGFVSRILITCRHLDRQFEFLGFKVANKILLKLSSGKCIGSQLRLRLFFDDKWMALSEVSFQSEVIEEGLEDESLQQEKDMDVEEPHSTEIYVDLSSEETKLSEPSHEVDDDWWGSRYLGVAIGILITVVVMLAIVVVVIIHRDRAHKRYSSVGNLSSNSQTFFPTANTATKRTRSSTVEDLLCPVYSEPVFTVGANREEGLAGGE